MDVLVLIVVSILFFCSLRLRWRRFSTRSRTGLLQWSSSPDERRWFRAPIRRCCAAWTGAFGAFQGFIFTAVPMRYGPFFGPYEGSESDGLQIVRLLRSPASDPPSTHG